MKSTPLALFFLLLAAPATAYAAMQLIPAGSLIECTLSEPKLSSKTVAVGDPVLCKVGYSEGYARFVLPYNSFLEGRFQDYKDPGHLVGKGWMELDFDRMIIEPDTAVPVEAKVVGVHGYNVDRQGRILGKGHPVRDAVEWSIPILWPIDILNLPRRGPRPTLKGESRLTLKVMDDVEVPTANRPFREEPYEDPYGLMHRAPSAYSVPTPPEAPRPQPIVQPQTEPAPPPIVTITGPAPAPPEFLAYPSPPRVYTPYWPSGDGSAVQYRPPYRSPNLQQAVTLMFNDGRPPMRVHNYMLTPTTLYILDRDRAEIPLTQLDVTATERINRQAGVEVHFPVSYRQ
jgi:hypothetical protein